MKQDYLFKQIVIQDLSEKYFDQLLKIFLQSSKDYNYPLPGDSADSMRKTMLDNGDFETKMAKYVAINAITDEIHAYCNLITNIGKTNRSFARGVLATLKSKRKQGIAKRLLSFSLKGLSQEIKILAFTHRNDDIPRGNKPNSDFDKYLEKIGGKFAFSDRRSGSKISRFDKSEIKQKATELLNQSQKAGFETYYIDAYKFKEQSNFSYPDYLKALEEIWNDMPRDDSAEEDWEISEDLHQDFYIRGKARNQHPWTFVTIHDETKEVAGLTETWILRNRADVVWQDDTGVVGKYRGNGLGLMLKYQMLAKLLEDEETKDVEWWTTHNAHSNEHMLRINEILGYEEIGTFNNYEFQVNQLKEMLNQSLGI